MNMPNKHDLKAYAGVAILVIIVAVVGIWAGGFPGQLSRFY